MNMHCHNLRKKKDMANNMGMKKPDRIKLDKINRYQLNMQNSFEGKVHMNYLKGHSSSCKRYIQADHKQNNFMDMVSKYTY